MTGNYSIKVDGEEIDHADTLPAAKRARDTIIYGGIGTEANTSVERIAAPIGFRGTVHIDHVEPTTTLIMILPTAGTPLPTVNGEACDGMTIWRQSDGKAWWITACGRDAGYRWGRDAAVNRALRLIGVRRGMAHVELTESTEY